MLNKTKIIGRLLPLGNKEGEIEKRDSNVYFSLLVPNPSSSITVIRCVAKSDFLDVIESNDDAGNQPILEINGYLRNEKGSRQIIVKATDVKKNSNFSFNDIDNKKSNQVRLLGKIITCLKGNEDFLDEASNEDVLSFKIVVPRENSNSGNHYNQNSSQIFFCRVQGGLKDEFKKNLKKGDIILLEGFLQTKKIVEQRGKNDFIDGEIKLYPNDEKKISRISSVICSGFSLIENDSSTEFVPHSELIIKRVVGEIKKINFDKPKESNKK